MQGNARVKSLEMAFIVFFFTEPVRFGSVFSVSGLSNRNRTGRFFKNSYRFNQFFFTVRFFRLFFFRFSRFN
jgi:hypothetical protein